MINPPPLQSAVDTEDSRMRRVAPAWKMWFNQLYTYLRGVIDYTAASIQTVTNGFSITIADNIQVVTLTPAGVLATGVIKMPANAYNGQVIQISTTQTVTALTVNPNAGQTVMNAPTTLNGGSGFSYYYSSSTSTWYRLY